MWVNYEASLLMTEKKNNKWKNMMRMRWNVWQFDWHVMQFRCRFHGTYQFDICKSVWCFPKYFSNMTRSHRKLYVFARDTNHWMKTEWKPCMLAYNGNLYMISSKIQEFANYFLPTILHPVKLSWNFKTK